MTDEQVKTAAEKAFPLGDCEYCDGNIDAFTAGAQYARGEIEKSHNNWMNKYDETWALLNQCELERDSLSEQLKEAKDAMRAVIVDAIACEDEPTQSIISSWALDKIDSALSKLKSP